MSSTVRLIGGAWRRHLLPIAPVEGLRPSPDRVRETVFNWLGQDCTGWRVLDLFAGTGALGFEAASRGAAEVHWVEQNRTAAQQLRSNAAALLPKWAQAAEGVGADPASPPRLQVHQADVLPWLQQQAARSAGGFDLIFADPPFRSEWMSRILPLLQAQLAPGGLIYLEWSECLFDSPPAKGQTPQAQNLAARMNIDKIDALRHLKAGQVHAHLVGLPAL